MVMAKRHKPTRSEATARAFKAMLDTLARYHNHPQVYNGDIQRLMAAVLAYWDSVPVRVTLGKE